MQTIARSMADTGPMGGRYMLDAPPIVGRYGKRPHSRMRCLQLRTVHDLSVHHARLPLAPPQKNPLDKLSGHSAFSTIPSAARVKKPGPRWEPQSPPRAENAANFFRWAANAPFEQGAVGGPRGSGRDAARVHARLLGLGRALPGAC